MAETTTTRMILHRWSAGADTPARSEFDTNFANIELLSAIDKQDVFASRPAAGVRGTYFWDTTNQYLWRDDGSGWSTVGSKAVDNLAKSSGAATVPLTIDTVAGQTANLFEAYRDGVLKVSISQAGLVTSVGRFAGTGATFTNDTVGNRVIDAQGASGQTADMFRLRNFAGTDLLKVDATGVVTGTYLNAGAAKALLGNSAYSNVANMSKFSGTPALEVYAATGGAGSTFSDFIYLRHLAADATAVTRRLGILMKVGDEAAPDAGRSGALYLESSAANFGNPKLVLHRADADVMTFDSTPLATIVPPLTVNGRITANPGSDFGFVVGSGAAYAQGSHLAFKAGSSAGFYFYSNAAYNATPGNAGGGTQVGQLDNNGLWTVSRLTATSTASAAPAQTSPAFLVGASGGTNLIASGDTIQSRNGLSASGTSLNLNPGGGTVWLGTSGQIVDSLGDFRLQGRKVTIQASQPGGVTVGDIWIDI